jgi:hypothetical protein
MNIIALVEILSLHKTTFELVDSNNRSGGKWEGEAPAELATSQFGRSLTLPNNVLVEKTLWKLVWSVS